MSPKLRYQNNVIIFSIFKLLPQQNPGCAPDYNKKHNDIRRVNRSGFSCPINLFLKCMFSNQTAAENGKICLGALFCRTCETRRNTVGPYINGVRTRSLKIYLSSPLVRTSSTPSSLSVWTHQKFRKILFFPKKKCGRLQLKNPYLSEKCPQWTNPPLS